MNARDLIEKLSLLEGRRIRITDVDGNEYEQMCVSIEYLPPGQRDGDQGNVILRNGGFMPDGAPAGFTMMAKNVIAVDEYDFGIYGTAIDIKIKNSFSAVTIEILE